MSLPSTIEALPFFVKTLGKYWMDPRMLVGTGRPYPTKEDIPTDEVGNGMWTWTTDGKLWVRIADVWVDMFALYQLTSQKNQAGGYAGIDQVTGKIDAQFIPSIALTDPQVVGSEAAMLALTAQGGDVAKRTDLNGATYMLKTGGDPTVLADWIALSGGLAVDSVNGKTGVVTLNLAEISETATYKRVSQTEKNTWNAKQDALLYDAVPTFQSTKIVNSGALFDYLKTIQSSVEKKTWLGSAADGNNRFNLEAGDADIDSVVVFTEGGVTQHEGVHFTVDAAKRYIEFNENPSNDKTYYLTYLSNIPVVSLTSVAVANVEGLLEGGKVKEDLLPEGIGGSVEVAHATALVFDKGYIVEHDVAGPIAYTFNAGSEENDNEAKLSKTRVHYLKADGINKPTFSNDFVIRYDGWDNTMNKINRLRFEFVGNGQVLVDITYI